MRTFQPAVRVVSSNPECNRGKSRFAQVLFPALCLLILTVQPISVFGDQKPRVRNITVTKFTVGEGTAPKVSLAIDITGDHLGTSETKVEVSLINLDTGKSIVANVTKHDAAKIVATVDLPAEKDPVKYEFRVKVAGESAIPEAHLSDFSVVVKKEEPPKPKPSALEITFETFKSEEYPNLHSLLITNKSSDAASGFSSNPALMKVDIVPAGATNVTIQPGGNSYQMLVTYLASEKFVPKGVIVTVFDPASTLANSQPKYFSTPFKEKPPKEDPNQPKITEIAITSMQRRSGYGTMRITGSGFGDYERSPVTGERELLCCLNRTQNPEIADEQGDRKESWAERKTQKDPTLRPGEVSAGNLILKDKEVCRDITCKCEAMAEWRRRIEERVNITLTPRNADYRIERTQIMYIDDKSINVYFEFSRWDQYSTPMRLEGVTLTVNKGAVRETSTATSAGDFKYSAVLASPLTFEVASRIGPPRDKNLEYHYTTLSPKDANTLFGQGVGENFYVIELAVVNNGQKKVAVPLGAIEAEVAWQYGPGKGNLFYEEGPATLPAIPLGAVSGYFDAYQKTKGKWAKVFNILDGISTLSTAMFPVIRELKTPTLILNTGVVPGLRKSIGDLSSEQLSRLTSMSWEGVEEIVPGGSKTKFIYIPRAEQLFGEAQRTNPNGNAYSSKKRVIDLTDLVVVGFEVPATEMKQATEKEPVIANGNGEKPE
jgi:hypothetical protein